MSLLTFKGGVHPNDGKALAKDKAIVQVQPKGDLVYPMSQHIGAPAVPIVAKGDHVLRGQMIAEAGGFVSAPIYASVSGTVKVIEPRFTPAGSKVNSIVIENDGEYEEVEYSTPKAVPEMSKEEIELIREVDDAILTPDKHIETKYGLGTIRNLSSGCKTLLNIVKHPEKVVCVEECGPNVLKKIFEMDNIKIYMSRPSFMEIPKNVRLRFNDKEVVVGSAGYHAWWSKEYERREGHDL